MKSIRISCLGTLAFAAGLVYAQPTITSVLDPYTGGTKLAPGGQAVITGTNLGVGPTVTVGGITAYNLVPPQNGPQMTIEIPVNAALGTTVQVIVTTGAGASAPFNITLTQYAPVLINLTSGPLTSPRHSNGVAVTASTPAAPGELITFYAIGLGPTSPVVATGALPPSNSAAVTTTLPTVTLGTNPVTGNVESQLASGQAFFGASYSGPESGSSQAFIGVYQVVDTVPAGTAAGSYPVSLTIGGVTSNSVSLSVGTAPTGPVITAIVGESGKTVLCPGDVAILSGLNLGASPTVTVGTKTAFVINSPNGGNQMTIQIPVDASTGAANVTLTTGGQTSAAFSIMLTQYAPVIPISGSVNPPFHQNGTPVTAANPAVQGETISISVYGLGPTNPVVPTGTLAPSNPSAFTVTTPTVNIGGGQATVEFAGLESGGGNSQIGTYFVNFTVPPNQAAGTYPLSVSIGGLTSNLSSVVVFTGPTINNLTNAASNITQGLPNSGIAQGAIFVIFGNNLGPSPISIATNAFQNTTLSGTSISLTVNGTTVFPLLYYTSATQIGALLPSDTPVGTGTITVTYNGTVGLAAPITVVANNLGIFTVTSDGQGVGIVTNADYSLVSVTPGTPCGGPYTTCGAANPGDTLILWATGLGPVNGSDAAGAGLGVPMPNIPLTLWVGGVQATVGYQGRSGCCIGEDQIVFTVPANVPLGCAVPLAVQIGSEISNYTFMAVAPKGSRTCTPSNSSFSSSVVHQVSTLGSGAFSFGQITLQRQPNSDNQVGAAGNTDYGKAQFDSFTLPAALQPFFISYVDDLPPGTCAVYNNVNGSNPGNYFTNPNALDAGPGIKVTGPNGSQTIPANAQGQSTLSAAGTFLSPGAYTLTGTGGANVGAFTQAYTIATPPTLTSPTTGPNGPPITVSRANGITFTWTGGAANSIVQIQGGNSTDNTGSNGVSFTCFAAASAGTFTIPPSVLLTLPPGDFVNSEWNFVAYDPYSNFSASGLNLGFIQASYGTAVFTLLQ
jgi:uncharacterized protein (TIGR03437 family)